MTWQTLRADYPTFIYEGYHYQQVDNQLELIFDYALQAKSGEMQRFHHQLTYRWMEEGRKRPFIDLMTKLAEHESLLFHIGLMESINYWKLSCAPNLVIVKGGLSAEQKKWWENLFYNGLGEFLYLNQMHHQLNQENLVTFVTDSNQAEVGDLVSTFSVEKRDSAVGVLIPVGGGKDSVVSLELLKVNKSANLPMVMSAPLAAYDCLEIAGYRNYLEIDRRIDPQLLACNRQGFLNGHVPFSAILAFISSLGAILTDKPYIALSNEYSANEPSVLGTTFNHQYSKSLDFEQKFIEYMAEYVTNQVHYFSLLRPLYEIDIAKLFATHSSYHRVFRSCNRGKRENVWCGQCSKCLFVAIILSPFLAPNQLKAIFGKDLLDDASLLPIFRELIGAEPTKPFECVGTVWEVRMALQRLSLVYEANQQPSPYLLNAYLDWHHQQVAKGEMMANQLASYPIAPAERQHCIPQVIEKITGDVRATAESTNWQQNLMERLRRRYEQKKILILGFGREGQSSYRFLRTIDSQLPLTIMDTEPEQLAVEWHRQPLTKVLNKEDYLKNLNDYDLIFKTPGIPGYLLEGVNSVCLTSQTEEFLHHVGQRVIGITGTKGKSTTSAFTHALLTALGIKTEIVGNIGEPALERLLTDDGQTYYVYEMSSYQTEFIRVTPAIAVILNLFPEHLDHYEDVMAYYQSKLNLFEHTDDNRHCLIYGCDNPQLKTHRTDWIAETILAVGDYYQNDYCDRGFFIKQGQLVDEQGQALLTIPTERALPGEHNLINCLVGIAVANYLMGDFSQKANFVGQMDFWPVVVKTLTEFKALPHRLQYVGNYRRIRFYDDSISTIPQATLRALVAIKDVQTLIIGGYDRGIDYSILIEQLNKQPELQLICLPSTGHQLYHQLIHNRKQRVATMTEAVELAYEWTTSGKACLLSPAAASYTFFKNFEERGKAYQEAIQNYGQS